MNRTIQLSYLLLALLIVLVASLHLGTFLITTLFAYWGLQIFSFRRSRALSVTLYVAAVVVIGAGLFYFASVAYRTLPKIAATAVPAMVDFAERHGIDLPFTDYSSLKSSALDEAREGLTTIGRYARIASFQTVLLIAGLVVALSIFLKPSRLDGSHGSVPGRNLYFDVSRELTARFDRLYQSFATVMGAQITISVINTVLTTLFLIFCKFPYGALLVSLVFLCGMIPIVGNLLSNTVIVGVGFTISPDLGILALIFLIAIHKLEYFLNSKIIGRRIDSPVWLTLIGLLVGERLMGVPGLILAPVLLHYIRLEASAHQPLSTRETVPVLTTVRSNLDQQRTDLTAD